MSKKRNRRASGFRYEDGYQDGYASGASASKTRTAMILGIMNLRQPQGETPTELWRDAMDNDRGASRRYLSLRAAERLYERTNDKVDRIKIAKMAYAISNLDPTRRAKIALALRRRSRKR